DAIGSPRTQHDACALRGEKPSGRLAVAAARARNDYDLSFDVIAHSLTPVGHDGISQTSPFLQLFAVPRPLDRDLLRGAVDLAQFPGRQFDGNRSDVLLQARKLRGPRNRNDPWLLGKQPGKRYLSRCRLLPSSNPRQQIDQSPIRLASLRGEARNNIAEVGTVELRVLINLSREETFAKRTEWNKPDAEFLEHRQ